MNKKNIIQNLKGLKVEILAIITSLALCYVFFVKYKENVVKLPSSSVEEYLFNMVSPTHPVYKRLLYIGYIKGHIDSKARERLDLDECWKWLETEMELLDE